MFLPPPHSSDAHAQSMSDKQHRGGIKIKPFSSSFTPPRPARINSSTSSLALLFHPSIQFHVSSVPQRGSNCTECDDGAAAGTSTASMPTESGGVSLSLSIPLSRSLPSRKMQLSPSALPVRASEHDRLGVDEPAARRVAVVHVETAGAGAAQPIDLFSPIGPGPDHVFSVQFYKRKWVFFFSNLIRLL